MSLDSTHAHISIYVRIYRTNSLVATGCVELVQCLIKVAIYVTGLALYAVIYILEILICYTYLENV